MVLTGSELQEYVEKRLKEFSDQEDRMLRRAVSLSSLLTGKGFKVYTSMPPDQADDSSPLKKAVLKCYQFTEDRFRLKFRDSKPEQGKTVFQVMARLLRKFSRLAEMPELMGRSRVQWI